MTPKRFFSAAVALFAASTLFSQSNNGRISGTVSEMSGAVIAGAPVTVTNQATQVTWKTTTDSSGFYVVTNLPVGTYNVAAEAAGFRKAQNVGYDLPDAVAWGVAAAAENVRHLLPARIDPSAVAALREDLRLVFNPH